MKFGRILMFGGAAWVLAALAGCNTVPKHALTAKQEQEVEQQMALLDTAKFTVPAFDIQEVDVFPRAVEQGPPIYPVADRKARKSGVGWIAFIVDTDGTVIQAQVVRASAVEFGEAALAAVKRWRFKPGLKNGVPVRVRMLVPVMFQCRPSWTP